MRYLPHTEEDIKEMLEAIGVEDLDDLFRQIPQDCKRKEPLEIPGPLNEWELKRHVRALANEMLRGEEEGMVFLGAGSYEHHVPEVIPYLLHRSEFVTSYTPYQPEVSQGTLQAIYEYQTLMTKLFAMEVSNASMYDGASALAEAVLMAFRVMKKRTKIAVSTVIHPHYRQVLRTYLRPTGFEIVELGYGDDGRTDPEDLSDTDNLAAVAIQSPNFFGCVEDVERFAAIAHEKGALLICCFTEPLAYGLMKAPGSVGADIVCGEGQSLGIHPSYGGPGLGIFCTKMKYARTMPGRLVGKTTDMEGRRGFVLTLATREQHIRREKATSNICTNNNLCALTAAIYLATLGGTRLRKLAHMNHDKCEYLKTALVEKGAVVPFSAPTFNEFVVRLDMPPGRYEELARRGIIAGLPLERYYPGLKGHHLLCVTETKTREQLDQLVEELT